MGPPVVCLHTGMRVRKCGSSVGVCLHRAAAEIHGDMVRNASLCVCGCMEQMLQETNHVRSYKPDQA